MTDLELTKLAAEAMGFTADPIHQNQYGLLTFDAKGPFVWNPLHDDAQAMALVKRFELSLNAQPNWAMTGQPGWYVLVAQNDPPFSTHTIACSLNRAIVQCIAQMQAAKVTT